MRQCLPVLKPQLPRKGQNMPHQTIHNVITMILDEVGLPYNSKSSLLCLVLEEFEHLEDMQIVDLLCRLEVELETRQIKH